MYYIVIEFSITDYWYHGCFSLLDLENKTDAQMQKVELNLNAYGTYDVATACYKTCHNAISLAVIVKVSLLLNTY